MIDQDASPPKPWPSRVGFVGLGWMGSALASNLLQDGLDVVVFDRSPETTRCFIVKGATAAGTRGGLGACDVGAIVAQRYSPPGMMLALALKDLRLVLAHAEQLAVPMPAASVSHDRLVAAVARGWAS